MKRIIITVFSFALLAGLTGCDSYLGGLDPLDKTSGEKLAQTESGMDALLANVYTRIPMEDFNFRHSEGFNKRNYNGVSGANYIANLSDEAVQSAGSTAGPEGHTFWTRGSQDNVSAWSDIRQVNLFIESVDNSLAAGNISQAAADRYRGEALFARAYLYFALVKRYGGVPLIDHVLDKDYVPGDISSVNIPRSSEKATWDFVLDDLDRAAELLPESVGEGDAFRATRWAALALKSRAALHAASIAKYGSRYTLTGEAVSSGLVGIPAGEANAYYKACIDAAGQVIASGHYSLYKANPANPAEAADNFVSLFLEGGGSEFIFGRRYLDGQTNASQGHSWSQFGCLSQINTGGVLRYGRISPSLDLADAFEDYTDDGTGKSAPIKTRTDGVESRVAGIMANLDVNAPFIHYPSLEAPFEGKDARLLATYVVPGSELNGVRIIMQGGLIKSDGTPAIYTDGVSEEKGGVTYYSLGAASSANSSGFWGILGGSEDMNYTTTGFSIRKYIEPTIAGAYNSSTATFIDIRLAEVYLNYAEAVAESGQGDANAAARYLNDIRHRAAHKDNIPLTVENVLKERRVELAFEGKRYWDLIRRREMHTLYQNFMHGALVPVLDLRGSTPDYIFVRTNFLKDEQANGVTFNQISYYQSIPGVVTSGLVQNPGY